MIIADQKALLDKYKLESETLEVTSYDETNNEYVSKNLYVFNDTTLVRKKQ